MKVYLTKKDIKDYEDWENNYFNFEFYKQIIYTHIKTHYNKAYTKVDKQDWFYIDCKGALNYKTCYLLFDRDNRQNTHLINDLDKAIFIKCVNDIFFYFPIEKVFYLDSEEVQKLYYSDLLYLNNTNWRILKNKYGNNAYNFIKDYKGLIINSKYWNNEIDFFIDLNFILEKEPRPKGKVSTILNSNGVFKATTTLINFVIFFNLYECFNIKPFVIWKEQDQQNFNFIEDKEGNLLIEYWEEEFNFCVEIGKDQWSKFNNNYFIGLEIEEDINKQSLFIKNFNNQWNEKNKNVYIQYKTTIQLVKMSNKEIFNYINNKTLIKYLKEVLNVKT